MINMTRPKSKYKQSTLEERAVQFAPFAALKGYDQCIHEASQVVEVKKELSEEQKAELNEIICTLQQAEKVRICYFDKNAYKTICGTIKKIDTYHLNIYLQQGEKISIPSIYSIQRTN